MACPYFVPREIVYDIAWPHPARLPLGAGWTGSCSAFPAAADSSGTGSSGTDISATDSAAANTLTTSPVDSARLRDFCNLGYATACPNLPPVRDWDAVRFSVANRTAEKITLYYVCEKAHAPIAHGTLTCDLAADTWLDAPADPRIRRLAASYLQAYRVRQCSALI